MLDNLIVYIKAVNISINMYSGMHKLFFHIH